MKYRERKAAPLIREIICWEPSGGFLACPKWKFHHGPCGGVDDVFGQINEWLHDPEYAAEWVSRVTRITGEDLGTIITEVKAQVNAEKSHSILRQNAAKHALHREQAATTQKDVEYREVLDAIRGQRDTLRCAMRDISQLLTDHYDGYTDAATTLKAIREITG